MSVFALDSSSSILIHYFGVAKQPMPMTVRLIIIIFYVILLDRCGEHCTYVLLFVSGWEEGISKVKQSDLIMTL